ncbi:PKD domain-containing protein [Kibdelosporangium persicum]|uniref:PASTA domain-containing protein n=1 Tax=Kibdelosporangium persicum TaxID=2698649 RepID=A0ABX2F0X2_9PSEU|nr:PKD domain-containing protein [Kibdelosporangium persicum]NRN64959.1 PASTA domain-containing protein [Kibdelosporangium persicum]
MSVWSRAGLAVVAALLLGVIVVIGSDKGEPVRDVRLLSGAAWLSSSKVGQVTLLDGNNVEVAAQVQVAPAGHSLEVAQQGSTAYAVDRSAGTVRRVEGGTYELSDPQAPIPDATNGLAVIPGRDTVYTVDKRRGMLAYTDPKSLAPQGNAVTFAAGTAMIDDNGTLWAIDARTGDLTHVRDGKLNIRRQVAQPGGAELTMVGGRPVVVDIAGRKAVSVDSDTGRPGDPVELDLRTTDTVQVSGSRRADRLYLVVGRGVLNVCDLAANDCGKVIGLREGNTYGPPVEAGDQVFVPDYTTGQVWIIDVENSRVIAKPTVLAPDVRFELLVRDGVVFYNDTNSERAGVIQLDGKVINAAKYDAGNPGKGLSGSVAPSAPPQRTSPAGQAVAPAQPPRGGVPSQAAQRTSVGSPPVSGHQQPVEPSSEPAGASPTASDSPSVSSTPTTTTQHPPPAEPRLEISMSTTTPTENQTVTLRVNNLNGEAPVSAQWTFGDGATGSGTTTTHRWAAARATPYLVAVTATMPDGRQAMASANVTVSAVPHVRLTVSVPGGGGSVTGGGINCPGTCSVDVQPNTQITLTAQPDATHQAGSWGGACAGKSGASCDVTVDEAKSVSHTFEAKPVPQATLTIAAPTGGRVLVGGGGTCPSTCSVTRNTGTAVKLTAEPADDRVFGAWGGACAGQGATCSLTMTGQQSVSVTFTLIEKPQITSLECGSQGKGTFSCTLTATPAKLQIRWIVDGVPITDENDNKYMTSVCGSDNRATVEVTVSNARGSDTAKGGSSCETGS